MKRFNERLQSKDSKDSMKGLNEWLPGMASMSGFHDRIQ